MNEIITNIYNSFVLIEIFISFRNYFVFFCKFMIHHSICILKLDSDHSTAQYFDSFHSNSNFSKHSLYIDYHENEIIYHRRRHRKLLQFYIFIFINRNEIHFLFRHAKEDNVTNIVFNKINKNVQVNWND